MSSTGREEFRLRRRFNYQRAPRYRPLLDDQLSEVSVFSPYAPGIALAHNVPLDVVVSWSSSIRPMLV